MSILSALKGKIVGAINAIHVVATPDHIKKLAIEEAIKVAESHLGEAEKLIAEAVVAGLASKGIEVDGNLVVEIVTSAVSGLLPKVEALVEGEAAPQAPKAPEESPKGEESGEAGTEGAPATAGEVAGA